MKKISLASLTALSIFFFACNGNSTTETTETDSTTSTMNDTGASNMNATDASSTAPMAMADDKTKDFSKEAATGGLMEVALGNIAMKNASSQDVKDFGKMMVDDHTIINNQLKELAAKKMVDLPATVTEDQQKHIDKLSKKTGTAFDKEYVSMMIDDHKKDIDAFKKNGEELTDSDYKTFISNGLPTLQKHLDSIQAIKARMK